MQLLPESCYTAADVNAEKLVVDEYDAKKIGAMYDITRELGRGAFGTVHLAKRLSDGKVVALKDISKDKADNAGLLSLKQEVAICREIGNATDPGSEHCVKMCVPRVTPIVSPYHPRHRPRLQTPPSLSHPLLLTFLPGLPGSACTSTRTNWSCRWR